LVFFYDGLADGHVSGRQSVFRRQYVAADVRRIRCAVTWLERVKMIRYQLNCAEGHTFEAWFSSSKGYDAQVQRKQVTCPVCGSSKVKKAIMAPRVARSRSRKPVAAEPAPAPVPAAVPAPQHMLNGEQRALLAQMRKLRDEMLSKSDYVGPRFAEEARRIHNEEAPARGIHGEATPEEVAELKEEGVEIYPVPLLPDDHN
jgi:hypothetical protein